MSKSIKPLIRNRFTLLNEEKNKQRHKSSRFGKSTIEQKASIENRLLEKSSDKSPQIQMTTMSSLPPEWVEQYDHCQELLRDLTEIKKEISALNARRLNVFKEKDQQEIDRSIFEKASQATSKVRECDRILKAIRATQKSTPADQHLCQHMCQALAIELQEKTRQMRTQQRAFVDQRKKFDSSTKVSFLEIAADKVMAEDYEEELKQLDEVDIQLNSRNKDILEMVESIHQLHEIYKELNELVIIQGTLLDRIDMNIEQASVNVSKGKESLQKAHEHQKSPVACRFIIAMIVLILILSIVLVVKYAKK